MSQSLSKVYLHIVFTTKHHQKVITESIREEMQKFIIGCLSNLKSFTEEIYINPDHLHILCTLPKIVTIAQLVSKIKAPSSKWIKQKGFPNFEWQDGYAAFSVSKSQIESVKKYIKNQPNHHQNLKFQNELLNFLEKYDVEYKEEYLFD